MKKKVLIICLLVCVLLYFSLNFSKTAQGQLLLEDRFREFAPDALIHMWEQASRSEKWAIELVILGKRSSALPTLRDTLLNGSLSEKMLAGSLLAEMRDRGSVDALLDASYDKEEKVQARAITALRLIGDSKAAPRFREIVQTYHHRAVLKCALAALGKIGSSADVPLIKEKLSNPDESVRVNAAGALALLGSTEGYNILFAATHGENSLAQIDALFYLGYINSKEATIRLEEIISDPQGKWKSYARIALAQQKLNNKSLQEKAEYLASLVKDPNRHLKLWAVEQLSELNISRANELLLDLAGKGGIVEIKAYRMLKSKGALQ